MKTFTVAQEAALISARKEPVWLLKLDLVSTADALVLYLSDRDFTLWGETWKPLVLNWGEIDHFFDPSMPETQAADTTIELLNTKDALFVGADNLGKYFRDYDLGQSAATLYLWLDNAGLTEPSGANTNDLIPVLTGKPEVAGGLTPLICPLDIVTQEGPYSHAQCPWGDLLKGRYTRNQWAGLPKENIGSYKPAVFGKNALVEGLQLSGPDRIGELTGPAAIFDPTSGAGALEITFPASGDSNDTNPYQPPCDIYVGDWRFAVTKAPTKSGGAWVYAIDSGNASPATYYLPTPLDGSTPLFLAAKDQLWPRSDESGVGPHSSSEPRQGAPYQLYHGGSDTGNAADGHHPGWTGGMIKKVYVDGALVTANDLFFDHSFGIAWIFTDKAALIGKAGNPETIILQWTSVDSSFTSGDFFLNANQLTALYPHGYNLETTSIGPGPCILGDFVIPASGGGAPVTTKLGLTNDPRYPAIGARIAEVRFVFRYTGPEVESATFNVELFGTIYSFDSTELIDGSGIIGAGWILAQKSKGANREIWLDNLGYPDTAVSPPFRDWDIYELSRDVTTEALAHIDANNGLADNFRAWFSGSVWPDTNSVVVLFAGLEITYEPVASLLDGPKVTALIDSATSTVGETLAAVIPADEQGTGFDDPTLPQIVFNVRRQRSICQFVRTVLKQSDTELKKNFLTGKWDLLLRDTTYDNFNPPPPDGGFATITEGDLLANEYGQPMIFRSRSAPDRVVNEVTVRYLGEEGSQKEVTLINEASKNVYGVRRQEIDTDTAMTLAEAEAFALAVLNQNSEVNDFYSFTFPLGVAIALEVNDILSVTTSMDALSSVTMRVVSVEIAPGSLKDGALSTITVNAQRYSKARVGFGKTDFGTAPFGQGQIVEN